MFVINSTHYGPLNLQRIQQKHHFEEKCWLVRPQHEAIVIFNLTSEMSVLIAPLVKNKFELVFFIAKQTNVIVHIHLA